MIPANPRFMGQMDTVPTLTRTPGEWTAAINNNMLSIEMSPLLSRLEHLCMREICGWFGLGAPSGGLMLSRGSATNLQAIVVARNASFRCQPGGVVNIEQRPVMFAGSNTLTSLKKAAMISGVGSEPWLRAVLPNLPMDPTTIASVIRAIDDFVQGRCN